MRTTTLAHCSTGHFTAEELRMMSQNPGTNISMHNPYGFLFRIADPEENQTKHMRDEGYSDHAISIIEKAKNQNADYLLIDRDEPLLP